MAAIRGSTDGTAIRVISGKTPKFESILLRCWENRPRRPARSRTCLCEVYGGRVRLPDMKARGETFVEKVSNWLRERYRAPTAEKNFDHTYLTRPSVKDR
jgi:hypothetical protein